MHAQVIDVAYASPDHFEHWHGINWYKCGSSDSGVINKIVKKQYDIPINHLADSKIITTFLFL